MQLDRENDLAISTTSLSEGVSRDGSVLWPLLIEALFTALAIALVLPLFGALVPQDTGRDERFRGQAIAVRGLPDPVLPEVCAAYGASAESIVAERLCRHIALSARPSRLDRLPASITGAIQRTRQAFLAPVRDAQMRIAEWQAQQRDGIGDVLALGHAIDTARAEIQPFLDRYAIDDSIAAGPVPLACATRSVELAFANGAADGGARRDTLNANALLLLAAALDGHGGVGNLANTAMLPQAHRLSGDCNDLGMAEALASSAALIADARDAHVALIKDEAMRALLAQAAWHWVGAMILGLALLHLARRLRSPAVASAICLAVWAIAAWMARVPWPLGGKESFALGRVAPSWWSMPAPYVLGLLGAALCLLLISPWLRTAVRPQRPASPFAYPGLVALTGVGWVVLLDLSAHGHFGNRYLALYHEGHLWLAMTTFSIVTCVRQPLGRALAWVLSVADGVASRATARLGGIPGSVALLAIAFGCTALAAMTLANVRQLTSELGRMWLIVGAAWFFFLRGTPLTERLARSGHSMLSLLRYTSPLLFVVLVLLLAMLLTQDMGPLLIAGYGAGALVAAAIAMWRHQRSGAVASAYALALLLFVAWIATTTYGLFRVAAYDQVAAARLENATAPLASANDHLALVTWFQRSAPSSGYGPGAVPWCGYNSSGACAGVPAQIQSDYTFTALVGMFGWTGAWCVTLGCVLWLYVVVRGHARATPGEPRLVRVGARMINDEQALLSWVCVCWVALTLCQLAVTVAGNLAVIPLTGVTYPF